MDIWKTKLETAGLKVNVEGDDLYVWYTLPFGAGFWGEIASERELRDAIDAATPPVLL